jgi:hypothetical protein
MYVELVQVYTRVQDQRNFEIKQSHESGEIFWNKEVTLESGSNICRKKKWNDVNVASLPHPNLGSSWWRIHLHCCRLRIQVSSLGPLLSLKVKSMTWCFRPLGYWTQTLMQYFPWKCTQIGSDTLKASHSKLRRETSWIRMNTFHTCYYGLKITIGRKYHGLRWFIRGLKIRLA